ncbi:MAG TPA: hypothetical protein VHE99_04040 [Gammaproteobacteria bacterium]|nr:hypothetical protein [Gammaproteobacteria bacterium]
MARKKGAGGKLNRTEILQARLNSKLRFAAEILSRLERRTVSSLVEGLIEKAAKETTVEMVPLYPSPDAVFFVEDHEVQKITLDKALLQIWSEEESDRFVAFAMCFPDLLNDYEYRLWEIIKLTQYFWKYFRVEVKDEKGQVTGERWWPMLEYSGVIREHLRQHWKILNEVVSRRRPFSDIRELVETMGEKVEKPENYPELSEVMRDLWQSNSKK